MLRTIFNKSIYFVCAGIMFSTNVLGQHVQYVATPAKDENAREEPAKDNLQFVWQTEQFADIGILRYQVNGWDKLSLNQKLFVYYLTEAGLSGRDIVYDQNYAHNLEIRKALEHIVTNYTGDKKTTDWESFMVYAKRVWFSNGIHHHYSTDKIMPGFSKDYFDQLLAQTDTRLSKEVVDIMFDEKIDNKQVNTDPNVDMILNSAINFYSPEITQSDAEKFYSSVVIPNPDKPISVGLNTRLIHAENGLREEVYKVGGLYSAAIEQIVYWLNLAVGVAENAPQGDALRLLIKYYQTGDLQVWDQYNIAWLQATDGDIDYINSFIENYKDPLNHHASYESIVEIKDFDASERMSKLSEHAQWFEDNSPIMNEHKRKNVVGVSYKVVNVASESGDASPSTAIGVNLPNADWIREDFGSKSVSLGNIVEAYGNAGGPEINNEFCFTDDEKMRAEKYGALAGKMHTAMHEVIGHASGKINDGVGTANETLKAYQSSLEEARADLVGLYYIMDPKMVEWGLIPTLDVGKTQYDGYIRNGMMTQLRRLEPGKNVEEAHMRNRQMIAMWAFEKGKPKNVIERKYVDGKTYFVINDYNALRELFGQLLREVQRIKSEGDYEAGKALIENYGVHVDQELHAEVLKRVSNLNIPPYYGFINPQYELVKDAAGNIIDVKISYPDDFVTQMLYYGKNYSFLKPGD